MNTFKIKVENNKVIGTRFDESEVENGWLLLEEYPQQLIEDPFDWLYVDGEFIKDTNKIAEEARIRDIHLEMSSYLQYLQDTDYIASKLAEANALGENVEELKIKYAEQLQTRKEYRIIIDNLKKLL